MILDCCDLASVITHYSNLSEYSIYFVSDERIPFCMDCAMRRTLLDRAIERAVEDLSISDDKQAVVYRFKYIFTFAFDVTSVNFESTIIESMGKLKYDKFYDNFTCPYINELRIFLIRLFCANLNERVLTTVHQNSNGQIVRTLLEHLMISRYGFEPIKALFEGGYRMSRSDRINPYIYLFAILPHAGVPFDEDTVFKFTKLLKDNGLTRKAIRGVINLYQRDDIDRVVKRVLITKRSLSIFVYVSMFVFMFPFMFSFFVFVFCSSD